MANPEHLEILKQGVDFWNRWREEYPDVRPNFFNAEINLMNLIEVNLSGAILTWVDFSKKDIRNVDFTGAHLVGCDFSYADLSGADLSEAELLDADFESAILEKVIFCNANLTQAYFKNANLISADFVSADLTNTNFSGANLSYADLSQAKFWNTILENTNLSNATIGHSLFVDVDLSKVKLDNVNHWRPSSISIDTIYKSGGNIPEIFLKKAGVPQGTIEHFKSLTRQAFEFYSCFISYSSIDHDFANHLYNDLQNKGVRFWLASEDLKIGDRFRTIIDEAIQIHDKLLLVLSETSIGSIWVEDEVESAFEKERRRKKEGNDNPVLFPINIDDAVNETNTAWAAKIRRSRHIGDFTKWKNHDEYQKVFDRLLLALNI